MGIKGFVQDENEKPVAGAKVIVEKQNKVTGDYELIRHHIVTSNNKTIFQMLLLENNNTSIFFNSS